MSETYGQYTVALPCACGGAAASHLAGRCTHLGVERAIRNGEPIPLFPAPICSCRFYSPRDELDGRAPSLPAREEAGSMPVHIREGGRNADGS